jgi:dihydropteroate synthase
VCRAPTRPYGDAVDSLPVVAGLPAPGRTLVVGVVNVTPDSFSDGGEFLDPDAAICHGLELMAEGADIIDVGGESTRPGAVRPATQVELRRVLPVVSALAEAGAVVSIDTMRTTVAAAAMDAGARLVNDVSGGRAEPDLLGLVAQRRVPYICMHWRGHSADMQSRAHYDDVVAEVITELGAQLAACLGAGIAADRLIADPGLGFAKSGEHNWTLLQRIGELSALGVPLLVGASRKRFLGTLLAGPDGTPRPTRERDDASAALSALLAERGVWGVRVHAVRASRDAIAAATRFAR